MDKADLALTRAIRHGWKLVDIGRHAVWLEHRNGKCNGSIYITPEGDVGYCPF